MELIISKKYQGFFKIFKQHPEGEEGLAAVKFWKRLVPRFR
jgi:hypothetical protein